MPRSLPLLDRIAARVLVGDGCWEWSGAKNDVGYSQVSWPPRNGGSSNSVYAHRVMYELFVGPIAPGLVIDHLCRNPGCVRPDHLEAVTQRENACRGALATKPDCAQGHPRSVANTYVRKNGKKMCRVCYLERSRARTKRERERRLAQVVEQMG